MNEPFPVDVRPDALDWLTAIGTVGATVLAALAIGFQVLDRRRRAEDDRRSQATLVSAWIQSESLPKGLSGKIEYYKDEVMVRNGSEEIVYDVWLRPLDEYKHEVQAVSVGIVAPQAVVPVAVDSSIASTGQVPFFLEFTDAAGLRWVRRPNGRLTRFKAARKPKGGASSRRTGSGGDAPQVPPKGPEQPSTTHGH